MGALPGNLYFWPTLAQGGALALLGAQGIYSWKQSSRLALAGIAALMLAGLFFLHLVAMRYDPASFIATGRNDFTKYLPVFMILYLVSIGFSGASFIANRTASRGILITSALLLIVIYLAAEMARIGTGESLGMINAVMADYGSVGRFPIPMFGTVYRYLFSGLMVVFPLIVMALGVRKLLEKSGDWLRLSIPTVASAAVIIFIGLVHLHVRRYGSDFSQFMDLMFLGFFAVLFMWTTAFLAEVQQQMTIVRQIFGGIAIGSYIAVLVMLINVPLTYVHTTDMGIVATICILAGGYLAWMVYTKLTIGITTELEASRQERLAAIGRLASITAHEIRNPLQSIRSYSQFIAGKAKGTNLQEPSEVIMRETDRLDSILRRLLDFARELKLNLEEVNLRTWWAENRSLAESMVDSAAVKLDWHEAPDEIAIFDAEKIRQVFVNVFKNAVEASPEGGNIHCSLEVDRNLIVMQVRDEGAGVDLDQAEAAFREFHSTKSTGSGLGLPISRRIMEAHEGRIYFDRRSTKGADVIVECPQRPSRRLLRRWGVG